MEVVPVPECVSEREAIGMLRTAGLTKRGAGRLLALGLAGDPVRIGTRRGGCAVTLFDVNRVRSLLARPTITDDEVAAWCPGGLFVSRRELPAALPWPEQMEALADGWALSIWTGVRLGHRVREQPLPFVATVAGFVVAGADLVDVRWHDASPDDRRSGHGIRHRLVLADPGPWFERFRDRRLLTGPGRPWHLREPAPTERPTMGPRLRGTIAG